MITFSKWVRRRLKARLRLKSRLNNLALLALTSLLVLLQMTAAMSTDQGSTTQAQSDLLQNLLNGLSNNGGSLTKLIDSGNLNGLVSDSNGEITNDTPNDTLRLEIIERISQTLKSNFLDNLDDSILASSNVPQSLAALGTTFIEVGTPSGDDVFFTGTSRTDVILSRQGNDVLLAVDPGAAHPGQGEIDFLAGGSDKDTFVLGDWRNVYYDSGDTHDLASILDFNPSEDTIQIHGKASNYQLVDFSQLQISGQGTAILTSGSTPDVVAILPDVSNLNLSDEYFQYMGDTPPKGPVKAQIKQFGTTGIDFSSGVAIDDFSNVYLTGATTSSLGGSNAGEEDVWVAKYDSGGNQQWIQQFGSSSKDQSLSVATDHNGNVYLTGLTFGNLGGTNAGTAERDAWVAKYNNNGNQQWIRQFGTPELDKSYGVATDDAGNVYLTGYTRGDLAVHNVNSHTDTWVAKYDTDGNQQWIRQFGTSNYEDSFSIAVDSAGNTYAGGDIFPSSDSENYDAKILKYDTNGNLQWFKQFGSSDFDFLWHIATDRDGNVFATGATNGNLGGFHIGAQEDAWIAKFDTNGNQQWAKQLGTSGGDTIAYGDATDQFGNVYVAGGTNGNLKGSNAGSYDAWVAKYDRNGNQVWIQQFGTPEYDKAFSIAVNSTGQVYVSGSTEGSAGATNSGSDDVWVAKLSAKNGKLYQVAKDRIVWSQAL